MPRRRKLSGKPSLRTGTAPMMAMGSYEIAGARSADSLELGDYTGYLPAPGAPEPLNGMGGCGCHGNGVGDATSSSTGPNIIVKVGTLAAAYVAFKEAGKHKGGAKWALYAIAAAAAWDGYQQVTS